MGAINGRHIARWNHRLDLLAQGAPIDAAAASTSADYMPWYLSITRRWMTPRGLVGASKYAPAVPIMTQFVSILRCLINLNYNIHNIVLTLLNV